MAAFSGAEIDFAAFAPHGFAETINGYAYRHLRVLKGRRPQRLSMTLRGDPATYRFTFHQPTP